MYYCGLDGGGTKTALCALDQDQRILCEKQFGVLNLNGAKQDSVWNTVRDILLFMESNLPHGISGCAQMTVGMAGASNQDAVRLMRRFFEENAYHGPLDITGDHIIALYGAIDGPGAVLISGTGSVCCGRDEHQNIYRAGGYGYLVDDVGSGYAIGRSILTAVVRADDGRMPATWLTDAVYEKLGLSDISGLISWLYAPSTGKTDIASLAALLIPAVERGDQAALEITENAAQDLARLVFALWNKAKLDHGELAMAGGILSHYPFIAERVRALVLERLPHVRIHAPYHSPAYGAALMALAHERA